MVCKENVVSWFRNLSSYKRIDVMCTLLNMCLPFEVRYLGTCVEEIGKRDYNDLRDTEHHANNASELGELVSLGVTDKRTRRKLALYVALLHSCNYACAVVLYKNLSNFDYQEIANLLNGTNFAPDDQPLEELLLLYTMALNHPAFTYEQKTVFGNIYAKLQEEEARLALSKSSATFKPNQQSCAPCMNTNERLMDLEMPNSCMMPPPPMQTYHAGDISMRNNAVVSGVPPGLAMPPPGLCLPGPEQMTSGGAAAAAQYVHLGFPSMNHHMPPWTGQVMMSNQAVYHTGGAAGAGDMFAYPASPLVSRQSSPSQSRSPSRSNSPMGRRSVTTMSSRSSSTAGSQCTTPSSSVVSASSSPATSTTNSNAGSSSLPPLPSLVGGGPARNIPSQSALLPPSRTSTIPAAVSAAPTFARHNSSTSADNAPSPTTLPPPGQPQNKQPPPPPRLRSAATAAASGESLRETLGKEMPNFKGNLQNFSLDEIRRMSDEDLREIGLTPNAMGQLRNIVKNQTSNGMNQMLAEKKSDGNGGMSHPAADSLDNEIPPGMETINEGGNGTGGKSLQPETQHPAALHHHQNHAPLQPQVPPPPSAATPSGNFRRYPTVPPLDPAQLQMYPAPQPMYAAQNAPCYACLTVPVAGMQNRYPRCNAQHMYCLSQLQAMRIDADSSRHCSQSSSSDSTGSRSPPETPPAAPWVGGGGGGTEGPGGSSATEQHHVGSGATLHASPQSLAEPRQQRPRRNQGSSSVLRHKNHQMVNGGGGGGNAGGNGSVCTAATVATGPPPSLPHCVSFPVPPSHSQLTYLPHAGHFPALRPSTGIYSTFSHGPYARPAYPTTAYQPNGEMMYQYPVNPAAAAAAAAPPPPPPAAAQSILPNSAGGTPPPNGGGAPVQTAYMPPPTPAAAAAAAVVSYAPAAPPPPPPAKISCCNCGSSGHLVADCKEQTMEDLTKKAQYRLDYSLMKQPGDCPSSDK